MGEWKEYKWGTIATLEYGKGLENYIRTDGKYPVYGTNGKIGTTDDFLCSFPSIIIGRKGAYRGVHYARTPFYVIDTAFYLNPKIKDLDMTFAYYQLLTVDINYMDSGSAIPSTSREDFYDLDIHLPPFPEQRAIASILSSLDDKIDLLHRQNKTLEQLAETLFRQWFVEGADDVNKKEKLGDVVQTTSGGTPSRNNPDYYVNGIYKWVKSKELQGTFIFETEEQITEEALRNSSAKLLPANSILIALYGATVGEYAILGEQAACNQAVCAIIPNETYPYSYLFNVVKTNKENLINLAVGSAQQNISQLLIKDLEVSSDKNLVQTFHSTAKSIFVKIKSNIYQIRTLTQMRDTLLPKLMSGEVRVKI